MEKILKLKAVCYEGEMPKEYEVTYHFGEQHEYGHPFIWCEYEGEDFFRLTSSKGQLPEEHWTFMAFHAAAYWLVLPLLSDGIVKITRETQLHPKNSDSNKILVEVAEGYYTKKEGQV